MNVRMRIAVALVLALVACVQPAVSAPPAAPRTGPSAGPRPGLYSGTSPEHPGLVQVELYPDQTAIIRRVVTLHLPPAETETLRTRLTSGCFEPAPRSIERCLITTSSTSITVTSKQSGKPVVLPWQVALDGATAPPARSRSR